jgi:hypothetical protein
MSRAEVLSLYRRCLRLTPRFVRSPGVKQFFLSDLTSASASFDPPLTQRQLLELKIELSEPRGLERATREVLRELFRDKAAGAEDVRKGFEKVNEVEEMIVKRKAMIPSDLGMLMAWRDKPEQR